MVELNKMKSSFTNLDRIYVKFILLCDDNNNNNNNNNKNNKNSSNNNNKNYLPSKKKFYLLHKKTACERQLIDSCCLYISLISVFGLPVF